jgi:hypothetical protein
MKEIPETSKPLYMVDANHFSNKSSNSKPQLKELQK